MSKSTDITKQPPVAEVIGGTDGAARFDMARGGTIPAEANRVGRFLQRNLMRDKREGPPARLVIRHVSNGRLDGDRVDAVTIDEPGKLTMESCGTIAIEIYKSAANDAEGRGKGKTQCYQLQAFTEAGQEAEPYSLPFEVVVGKRGQDGDGVYADSFSPTEAGITAMAMKFSEKLADQFVDALEGMVAPITVMKGMLETSIQDNAALRTEIRAQAKAVEDGRQAEWTRTEESKARDAQRELWKEMAGMVKVIGPALGKRFGLIDANQPIPADEAHVAAFVQNLVDEDKLGWFLSDDCPMSAKSKALLIDLSGIHLERIAKRDAAKAGPPPTSKAGSIEVTEAAAGSAGPPATPGNGNGKSNGNGHATVSAGPPAAPSAPQSTPHTPEEAARIHAAEIAACEVQMKAWAVKAERLKAAGVPAVPSVAQAPVAATQPAAQPAAPAATVDAPTAPLKAKRKHTVKAKAPDGATKE